MKRCSQCGQTYTDEQDLNYCLSDGALLVTDQGGFSSSETPTQFIPRPLVTPYQTSQVVTEHSAKWVFPVVGILCGLVVVFGFFAFFKESPSDKSTVAQKNTEVAESPKNTEIRSSPRAESTPVPPPPSQPPPSVKQTADYPVVTVNSPRDGYLALKSEPCTAPCGALLIKIPHRTRLALGTCKDYLEVADRRQGRWCYTSYGGHTGWIFDAFVTR